jgi:hypothetical protein
MNATFRLFACCVVVASATRADSPPAAVRVVVLDNENLLEGEVTRVETGYQVRRPVGGDVTLPAKRVLAVVADRRAAFDVVAARANLRDADERLRLANWCLSNRLMPEALAEARAAARMRDRFAAAERLVKSLEQMAKAAAATPEVVPAKAEAPAKTVVADVKPVDYNSESFPLFASKVNAILVNTCATCHAAPESKAFKLTRAGGRSGVSQNLMAALPHVNPADPLKSPLLVNAITPHGTATEAPLRSRVHPAYASLETWVRFARSTEGTAEPEPTPKFAEPRKLPDLEAKGDVFGQDSKSEPPKPAKSAADDPFDPALFNRKK